jgi:hypothetical protein
VTALYGIASRSNVQCLRHSSISHRIIDGEVLLHSSSRIILDDGHGRQGHFALPTLARLEEYTEHRSATAKVRRANLRMIVLESHQERGGAVECSTITR